MFWEALELSLNNLTSRESVNLQEVQYLHQTQELRLEQLSFETRLHLPGAEAHMVLRTSGNFSLTQVISQTEEADRPEVVVVVVVVDFLLVVVFSHPLLPLLDEDPLAQYFFC